MRTIAMLGLLVAASLLCGPASAAHKDRTTHVTGTANTVAASTVTHHKRSHKSSPPAAASRWPDPSTGPGHDQFLVEQRAGRCVMDEGYGRWTYCDNH